MNSEEYVKEFILKSDDVASEDIEVTIEKDGLIVLKQDTSLVFLSQKHLKSIMELNNVSPEK